MTVILSETDRLILRQLEEGDLATLVDLINDWEIARWLAVVPFPYCLKNAQEFYTEMNSCDRQGLPQYFAIIQKSEKLYLGGVGLHPPRYPNSLPGEIVLGYWLGKVYWGQGIMTEAVRAVLALAFRRNSITTIIATTDPLNHASQAILRKTGFKNQGRMKRNYPALRGSNEIIRWSLSRETILQPKVFYD